MYVPLHTGFQIMPDVDGFQLACRLDKSALSRSRYTHYSNENLGHFAGNQDHD